MNTPSITDERREFLRRIGRRGGEKRAQSFTVESQRLARSHVSHDACVANGRKGGIAYIQKHGARKLVEQTRQYRLEHPSDLESIVHRALDAIGASNYEREVYVFPSSRCKHNTGDFVFRKAHKIVYADGAAWHNGKVLPKVFIDCADRRMRDERFDTYLRYRGWQVLRLSESEIKAYARGQDNGANLERLKTFLALESKR